MKKEVAPLIVIILLLSAVGLPLLFNKTTRASTDSAYLTGNVYDYGEDTDSDGLYNYLVAKVEANVTVAGTYRIQVNRLGGEPAYEYVWLFVSNEIYLEEGIQNITVSFNGIVLHGSGINVTKLVDVYFYDEWWNPLSIYSELNLTETYNYDLFDVGASLTGTVIDAGVDTDSDGLYDYLDMNIEIDVEDAGLYALYAYGLANASYAYVGFYYYKEIFLTQGIHYVNFPIYGPIIYASHVLNISTANWLYLYLIEQTGSSYILDYKESLPLSNTYDYTNFESHAQLTGKITDEGVDTDGNGLFDYLRVGVEINVTEAGNYGALIESLVENETSNLYIPKQIESHFNVGNHTIYFEYPGQMFAYYHFSPANLSYIRLYEADVNTDLGYIESASLSRRYDYTLFDAPLNDMQFNFVVYPNGTIGVDGTINYTRMYPENMGPQINASMGISTNGNTTTGSLDGRLVFTEESMSGSPFNFIAANFSSKYDSGLVNSTLNLILFVPPEATNAYPFNATDFDFTGSYRNGILNAELWGETQIPSDVKNTFPFNATDLTILADYLNGEIIGNITFHLIPGAPMLDVRVYFSGNKTDIYLTGNVNVTYGNYFGIEINSTMLEDFLAELNSAIPGATGLIANMTGGLLECTSLSTAKTEWTNGLGADVQYNAAIHGNFTLFFARVLAQMFSGGSYEESIYAALESAFSSIENASLRMYYFHDSGIASIDKLKLACNVKKLWSTALELVLSTVPPYYRAQVEAGLKIANATAYAIQDFSLNATYSKETQKLFFDVYILSNATQLEEETRQLLPEMLPPPMQEIFASYMNVTYCKLTRYEATVKYENGTADFEVDWTFEGDFKAQLNHMKRFYIDFVNATSPWMLNWQLLMLNETEIDIKNFNAEFMLGKDQLYITFNGAYAKPPIDEIDFIRFKLYRWFNMTADPEEPPREFERLKITITGASNGTHTILLSAPDMVPTPDSTSLDYKSMTWENVTLSSLKDLIFRIAYQAVVDHLGERYYIPIFTNSTVSNFNFNSNARQISFNVTGEAGTGFCEITIPRALLYASVSDWIVKIDGQPLTSGEYNVTENAEYVFISLNYSHSSHLIEIVGTWVITEFQPPIIPIVLVTLSLIAAAIVFKQRKRITIAKTRWQNAIQTFVNRIRPLKA